MKKSTFIILIAALLVMGTGCTKFGEDLNINPNLPSKAANSQLLTYAINQIPNYLEAPTPNLYAQYWSEKPYTDASRYLTVNFDFYGIYSGPLMNLKTILDAKEFKITEGSKENQLAVARILRAWFYWHATDRWGDIPYLDALQGKDNFTPAYTSQKDIYYDLLKELKEAAAQISDADPVTGDILFKGEMRNWKKFANSMRLIMALRLSKIDEAKGKSEFADAATSDLIDDNSESAVFVHLANAANQSYWYYVYTVQSRIWYWASEPIVDYLKELDDPRLPIYADTVSDGSKGYKGVPYGLDGNAVGQIPTATVSPTGVHIRTQNAPCYILTYAQVQFALAEGAKINWIGGGDATAKQHYEKGIEASIRQWVRNSYKNYNDKIQNQVESIPYSKGDQGDTTGLAAYMAKPEVAYTPADALKKIGYQRWLHLYANGYEAWAEWRRTGFPVLTPAPNNNNTPIPRRQGYPVKEQNINGENYTNAVNNQPGLNGKDDLTGRVWWDKP
jgi:hypothetical protein